MNLILCVVEILETPTLTKPGDVVIVEEEEAVFETRARGIPPPSVEWFLGPKPLVRSDKVVFERQGDTHRLVLSGCEMEQTGLVSVTATNKAGELTQEAMLTVKGA